MCFRAEKKRITPGGRVLRLIGLAVSLLLAGSAAAQPGAQDAVRLQLSNTSGFQFAGYYAALDQGYYLEEGLKVSIIERASDESPADEVLSGRAEFGVLASELVRLRLEGKPLVAVAAIFQESPLCFVTLADSLISSPADLIGKRVQLDDGDIELRALLRSAGVPITDLIVSPRSRNIEDLVERRTDAIAGYVSSEPNILRLRGAPVSVIRPTNYGVDLYGDTLFTSEVQLREHPARVAAFRRATLRGWQYALDHRDQVIDSLMTRHGGAERGQTRDLLRFEATSVRDLILPDLIALGEINRDRVQRTARMLTGLGLVAPPAPAALTGFVFDPSPPSPASGVVRWLMIGLAASLMIGAVATIWNVQLRRAVERQTQEYRESERRLVEAQAIGRVGDWQVDLATGEQLWSREVYRIMDRDPALGPPAREESLEKYTPEDRARLEEAIRRARELKETTQLDLSAVLPSGRLLHQTSVIAPVVDEDGKVIRIVGTVQDITARKAAEAARAQLASIVESSNDAIISTDLSGHVTSWNEGAERLFGYAAGEITGRPVSMLIPPGSVDGGPRLGQDARIANDETTRVRKDGRAIEVSITISPVRDESGRIIGASSIIRDITERKRAEARYRSLIDHAPDAIVILDVEAGRFVEANPGACRLHGLSRDVLLTKNHIELSPPVQPDGRPSEEAAMEYVRAALMGQTPVFRWDHLRADGTVVPCEIRLVSIPSEGGLLVRGSITDITDRLRNEENLKRRTEDLERSNRELERFAYVASHDLQEPLRMVTSFTQLLAKRYSGKLGADADEFIGYAVDGAKRMQMLIDDLLAYSRAGKLPLKLAQFPVDEALDAALANLRPTIETTRATVTRAALPTVFADQTQMVQVLQNLVANALKFTKDRVPTVHIAAARDNGDWVFSVQDNGIGIDPRHTARLFVMFQRLHPRHEYPGSGIGLAICKMIVERLGGRIWVQSTPGEGSTFLFSIPERREAIA